MKIWKACCLTSVAACLAVSATTTADETTPATKRIAWYGTLKSGLQEAKRTGKPILLVSAAPHCTGVSGVW